MKRKTKANNTVKGYPFISLKQSAVRLEPKEIATAGEAAEIGIHMARIASQNLKLDLSVVDQTS